MLETRTMRAAEAKRIQETKEGHYADVKRIDIAPAKLSRTISAFANTSGGEVFIGIAETTTGAKAKREWIGFENPEAANGHIQALEQMAALGTHYRASFLTCAGCNGLVLHVTVFKTTDVLRSTDGTPYVRRNAQNLPVDTEEKLARLRLNKGIVSFEDQTVKIPIKALAESRTIDHFLDNIAPRSEPHAWLASQFLIMEGNPTVAGTLLFCDEPQAALPKRSAVKIYRYKTKEDEGDRDTLAFDPITIEGPVYDLIDVAVKRTKALIEGIKRLGMSGMEDVSYPHETLHEIVTNAVLHRDYSIAADIHIRIYDNRIEVESPGRLPGYVTVKNILDSQSARNPKLVRLINKFPNPPNKDVGEGLNTAFEAMKKLRLKEPEIEEGENSVIVYIGHAPLASPEDTVLTYLETHDEITNRVARELTGIRSENSMKDVFLRLKKANLIEPVPDKKGNAYAWQRVTGGKPKGRKKPSK